MKFNRCKGSRDLSPQEMSRFRRIEDEFRKACLGWGYQEVRTPTLEYLHLFTSTGTLTPNLLGRVYSFLDWDGWSGERVVLRPDGTIPIVRLYTESMADRDLARLFYVANMFVFDSTGKETREKWQCGAELIGGESPLADVELVMLIVEVLQGLGLKDIEFRFSHAGLIRGILARLGLSPEERTAVFDRILDGDLAALEGESAPVEFRTILPLLVKLKGKSAGFVKNLRAMFNRHVPELEPGLENLTAILDSLEALGCPYRIDLSSGRSFEYYTGLMYQVFSGDTRVGGGGRYDALIPLLGGRSVPASGFALYLDELMELVPTVLKPAAAVLVRFDNAGAAGLKEGFAIAARLRQAGFVAELKLGGPEPSGYEWTVDVQDRPRGYVLTNLAENRSARAGSPEELLKLLGRG